MCTEKNSGSIASRALFVDARILHVRKTTRNKVVGTFEKKQEPVNLETQWSIDRMGNKKLMTTDAKLIFLTDERDWVSPTQMTIWKKFKNTRLKDQI